MANQFTFVSPGAAMARGLDEFLQTREMARRQSVIEKESAERLKLAQEAEARVAKMAQQQEEKMAQDLLAAKDEQTLKNYALGRPGDVLTSESAAAARAINPALVQDVPDAPMVGPLEEGQARPVLPGVAMRVGLPEERKVAEFLQREDVPIAARQYVEATGDLKGAAKLLEPKKMVTPFVRNKEGKLMRIDDRGELVPHIGPLPPKDEYQIVNEPSAGQVGMPYSPFMIQSGTGFMNVVTDKRTGETKVERVADTKPGEAAGKDIAGALGVNQQIDQIKSEYNPTKVGVITGRLKNLDQKYWGADPDYARFRAELATLGNTVIQLRTGAQMSVQEAERIMEEIATSTLPPSTFVARLNRLEELYDQYLANRAKIAYGRVSKEDITAMTEGKLPPGSTTAPTTPAPAPRAKPSFKVTVE